jgi:centromeric protein E
MQSRLEEEEQAKAALMGRIQRLTKLILVSTKTNIPFTTVPEKSKHRRCHSFGEEELAHLPDKRRDLMWEDDGMRDQGVPDSEGTGEVKGNSDSTDDSTQEEKKSNKKRGMLAWFKIRVGPSMFFPWFKHPKSFILVLIALDEIWILSNRIFSNTR